MKTFLWVVAFTLVGLGLGEDPQNDTNLYHEVYSELKAANPDASHECLEVATATSLGNYEAVSHMMATKHGRCATRVLGLVVRLDSYGNVK